MIPEGKINLIFKYFFAAIVIFHGCNPKEHQRGIFEVLDDERTGLHFTNKLTSTPEFNLFKYMYFYNGAGVGAGDFNNDGKTDIFFASNQGDNKLFLNQGDLRFKDVTSEASIPQDKGWSTGVSVVDINGDELLDIYICKVGNYETLHSRNQFLICKGLNKNGVPVYVDEAPAYGLAFSGFSTQAAFFDYDADGDLDMYLLNHSIHQNANFAARAPLLAQSTPLSGDRLYRNDGNTFSDVTRESGINSSLIGYGLGVVIADVNVDGKPDIYIGNDFHENDYLYINQGNGFFKEELAGRIMHASKYSMGVDIADINNDAWPEIISMDMLPYDPYILKRSLGEEEYDLFKLKISYGYNHQYSRNNLQLNRGNGIFSEVGLYSGIHATDWSWAPLFLDFDNDGLKDLFISNGIPKRMNDIDFINYISTDDMQSMILENRIDEINMSLIDKFPQIKIPNKFYSNTGNLAFKDLGEEINDKPGYSNGAAYADFDNDGDLDLVVNNIDEPALLYRNTANDDQSKPYVCFKLKGPNDNPHAIGAKVILFSGNEIRTYDNYPVKGFMSSMNIPVHIGLHNTPVDSLFVIWPDNRYQRLTAIPKDTLITLAHSSELPVFHYTTITSRKNRHTKPVADITSQTGISYLHEENVFNEFDRESLIPHMVSTEGPALAVSDINHDGRDDIFIGSSKGKKPAIFLQNAAGKFNRMSQPALDHDSTYEDVDAIWSDVNNDRHPDLVVASGGNEYYGPDPFLSPRIYLNDGNANFNKLPGAFENIYVNASSVAACDFNGDGFEDLFLGGRSVPWEYGQIPRSYLLLNNGQGKFQDVTERLAKGLSHTGMVTHATWVDMDKDRDKDLLLAHEWGTPDVWINNGGKFSRKQLTERNGWWNFLLPCDLDNDGDIDLVAGNLGSNSRLKTSQSEPVKLYYEDFDGNGKKEQIVTYYLAGKQMPFTTKMDLEKQMPVLKKKFLKAEDFAKSTLEEVFPADKLNSAAVLSADYFSNAVLLNDGNLNFSLVAMPWQAQLGPFRDGVIVDANGDQLPDVLLGGNYYDNNIASGRYDADYGTILVNRGGGKFSCELLNGLLIMGQVRHIRPISINERVSFILAKNNDSTQVIRFARSPSR